MKAAKPSRWLRGKSEAEIAAAATELRKVLNPYESGMRAAVAKVKQYEAEALRLYELLQDAGFKEIAEDSAAHALIAAQAPSAGCIAMLIELSRDRLEERQQARRSAEARRKAEKRHGSAAAEKSALQEIFNSDPKLQLLPNWKVAAALIEMNGPDDQPLTELSALHLEKNVIPGWRKALKE